MRKIWLYALPLALIAYAPMNATAAARIHHSRVAEAYNYGNGTYSYNDVLKPHGHARGEAAEQAATWACDRGDPERIGLAPFNACMRAQGWRFARFEPASPSDAAASEDSNSTPSAPDTSGIDATNAAIEAANQQAASDAQNAAAQQQFIDGMAAAQQTMNNANFSQ